MALPSLFKLPSNKIFNFKTRYYDADKEDLEERVERAKRDAGITNATNNDGVYVPNIKGRMKHYMNRKPIMVKERQKSNFRVFAIAAALALFAYYILF
ncbi:MAG: hypothetical protein B6I20_01935 [Bacteroidetes bacterium 4572_117]|nr:MAG: hypothetical protein B6I20_01935 [Bacteroidetes bacterium 4572_117]